MTAIISIFVFLLGAIVGSFLNVVILRFNTGQSMFLARSKCFSCGKPLSWFDMIPVFSFIFLRGKCRQCGSKISWQYPTVEAFTGLLFLFVFLTNYTIPLTIYYAILFSLLIIIGLYDWRHQIIPDTFVYSFDFLVLLCLLVGFFSNQISNIYLYPIILNGFWPSFIAGLAFFVFFALFWLISKGEWMGLGDAKLALGIGWLLGPLAGLLAVFISFWLGSLYGLSMMVIQKKMYNIKSKIPFGPFMIAGLLISFFWGQALLKFYFG